MIFLPQTVILSVNTRGYRAKWQNCQKVTILAVLRARVENPPSSGYLRGNRAQACIWASLPGAHPITARFRPFSSYPPGCEGPKNRDPLGNLLPATRTTQALGHL